MNRRTALQALGGILAAAGVTPAVAWLPATPHCPLGTRAADERGNIFSYIQAGKWPLKTGDIVDGPPIGIVAMPIKPWEYGWIQTYGRCIVNMDDGTRPMAVSGDSHRMTLAGGGETDTIIRPDMFDNATYEWQVIGDWKAEDMS